ncbi:MAG: hypothetical protein CL725_10610 [Chloroflexi bacterium]|nr:hypothetical protein [Chloroflexota bacterium]
MLRLPDDSAELKDAIASSAERSGYVVDSTELRPGESTNSDAIISYIAEWGWDLATYLRSLQIVLLNRSGDLVGRATWRDSPMHGFRDAKVVAGGLMNQMLPKREMGASASQALPARSTPPLPTVLSYFDKEVLDDVDDWRDWWKDRPSSPYGRVKLSDAGKQGAGQVHAVSNSAQPSQSSSAPSLDAQLDEAILQAERDLVGVPPTVDGCPTTIRHLDQRLPVCPSNERLKKMRRLWLATDASFRKDISSGLSLKEIAIRTAQAARESEAALAQTERGQREAAASLGPIEDRIKGLREIPSRCSAAPDDAFGMNEQSYQQHVNLYMAAIANRAVSVIAACRARAGGIR